MISLCNFILPNCAAEHPHLTWVAVAAMETEEGAVVMGCRQGAQGAVLTGHLGGAVPWLWLDKVC